MGDATWLPTSWGSVLYADETPDREFFVRLAHECGFDVDAYLAALDRVAAFSHDSVAHILEYNKALVTFIADLAEHALLKIGADQRIRDSERKFHAVFDQAYQLLAILSVDGKVLEANRHALTLGGARETSLVGTPFWDTPLWAHSPQLRQQVRTAVQKASEGCMFRFDSLHPGYVGDVSYFDFSITPITDDAGQIALLIAEGRDVTEARRAHERTRRRPSFSSF